MIGKATEDFVEGAGNTVTTKSIESENASNESHERTHNEGKGQIRGPSENDEAMKQILQTNHQQFNLIAKLKKDLIYWQQK
jgi:hypothetical protein